MIKLEEMTDYQIVTLLKILNSQSLDSLTNYTHRVTSILANSEEAQINQVAVFAQSDFVKELLGIEVSK